MAVSDGVGAMIAASVGSNVTRPHCLEERMDTLKTWLKHLAFSHGYTIGRIDHESTLPLYVASLLLHLGISCVLDVGAHFGEFAVELRKHGYRGKIVSFEPVRENLLVLKETSATDPNWVVYPFALGSQDTVQTINISQGTNFSSFLHTNERASAEFAEAAIKGTEAVAVKRLDGIFADITADTPNPRVYLKMDTQGWDLEVVKGATGCLAHILALQTEMSVQPLYEQMPTYLEAIPYLNRLGFDLSAPYRVSRDAQARLIEFDCVMVNSGATLQHALAPSSTLATQR
jgi:FkbM family methyltransferase